MARDNGSLGSERANDWRRQAGEPAERGRRLRRMPLTHLRHPLATAADVSRDTLA